MPNPDRRALLRVAAAAGSLGIAGCLSSSADPSDPGTTERDVTDTTGRSDASITVPEATTAGGGATKPHHGAGTTARPSAGDVRHPVLLAGVDDGALRAAFDVGAEVELLDDEVMPGDTARVAVHLHATDGEARVLTYPEPNCDRNEFRDEEDGESLLLWPSVPDRSYGRRGCPTVADVPCGMPATTETITVPGSGRKTWIYDVVVPERQVLEGGEGCLPAGTYEFSRPFVEGEVGRYGDVVSPPVDGPPATLRFGLSVGGTYATPTPTAPDTPTTSPTPTTVPSAELFPRRVSVGSVASARMREALDVEAEVELVDDEVTPGDTARVAVRLSTTVEEARTLTYDHLHGYEDGTFRDGSVGLWPIDSAGFYDGRGCPTVQSCLFAGGCGLPVTLSTITVPASGSRVREYALVVSGRADRRCVEPGSYDFSRGFVRGKPEDGEWLDERDRPSAELDFVLSVSDVS